MPDRPYLHQMGGAAPQNEHSEHPENPVERKIFAAPQQIDQGKRDAVVGEGDNSTRDDVQPHDLGGSTGSRSHGARNRTRAIERRNASLSIAGVWPTSQMQA